MFNKQGTVQSTGDELSTRLQNSLLLQPTQRSTASAHTHVQRGCPSTPLHLPVCANQASSGHLTGYDVAVQMTCLVSHMPSVRTPGYCRRTGGRFDLPDEPTNSTESKSCPWTAFSSAALIPLTIPLKGKQGQLQTEPAPSSIAHALEPLLRALCRSSLLRSEGISSMLRQEDLRTHHRPSSQQCWDTTAFLSQQQTINSCSQKHLHNSHETRLSSP